MNLDVINGRKKMFETLQEKENIKAQIRELENKLIGIEKDK